MITSLDAKVMDINSEVLGVGPETLMDNAGRAVANLVKERFPGKKAAVFCGRGNNGGDGLAAAFYLENADVYMIDGNRMRSDASNAMLSRFKGRVRPFTGKEKGFDILIDAGLGTGLTGELRPAYGPYVDFCNSFKGTTISVDVPSGFGTGKQVVPDITVTMVDIKEGMDRRNSGETVTADIGMPPEAGTVTGPGDMLRYPLPKEGSHKGDNGRLLVVGGGPYFGAPALSAKAAMRAGADYVRIATPDASFDKVAGWYPESVMHRLPGDILTEGHLPLLLDICREVDAVVIGPGLGRDPRTCETVKRMVSECGLPAVVDADGLYALGKNPRIARKDVVLTPHLGEFVRLGGEERSIAGVKMLSERFGCTVALKGAEDIISDGDRVRTNRTGCPAMTSAGTGDVLAGVIGGLLAKGMSAFDAACLGTYLCGKAGELSFARYSYGLMATDVADDVAAAVGKGLERIGL